MLCTEKYNLVGTLSQRTRWESVPPTTKVGGLPLRREDRD